MNIGWNFRREHLRPEQRSHYVITNGGDQPNVVPSAASVWYYIREMDYRGHQEELRTSPTGSPKRRGDDDRHHGDRGAILGSAWPRHFNKAIAETMNENIKTVGLPEVERGRSGAWPRAFRRNCQASRTRAWPPSWTSSSRRAEKPDERRLRRHRRRLLGRADRHPALPLEHSGAARASLGQRHRHGDADRPQGRDGGRQGHGHDDARPPAPAGD